MRIVAAAIMATVALTATPDGVRIIAVAAVGAGVWAIYHALRERRGGVMGNQPFEWPRLLVWVAVCVAMVPVGGLIGLALVVFMILGACRIHAHPLTANVSRRSALAIPGMQPRIVVCSAHA